MSRVNNTDEEAYVIYPIYNVEQVNNTAQAPLSTAVAQCQGYDMNETSQVH